MNPNALLFSAKELQKLSELFLRQFLMVMIRFIQIKSKEAPEYSQWL